MTDVRTVVSSADEPIPFMDLILQHQSIANETYDAVRRVLDSQKFIQQAMPSALNRRS